jgi:lipopolysaccharide export system protein LptC
VSTARARPRAGTAGDADQWSSRLFGPRSNRPVDAALVRPSRVIRVLKYGLPVTAVLLAALLLAWPHLTFKVGPFEGRIELGDNRLVMRDLRYEGKDDRGRPYVVNAERAIETRSEPREVEMEQLKAELQLSRGFVLARADRGKYYEAERRLDLHGNVQVFDPSGYELRGESAIVNLRDSLVLADEPVEAQGPLGIIHGNAAAVSEKGQHIYLYRGVRATLYPDARGSS